jgi:hypothetical protein
MPSVSISLAVRYSASNDLRIDTSVSAILTSTARKSSDWLTRWPGGWPVTWGEVLREPLLRYGEALRYFSVLPDTGKVYAKPALDARHTVIPRQKLCGRAFGCG